MNVHHGGLLLAAALLGGCGREPPPVIIELPATRPVATLYQIATSADNAPCYHAPDANSRIVTVLRNKQLADLVSLDETIVHNGGIYWVHIYPRLGHRPSCYIDSRNLVPVS